MSARLGLRSFESLSILVLLGGVGWCQMKTQDAVQDVIGAFKGATWSHLESDTGREGIPSFA